MRNLKQETSESLERVGLTKDDVRWVGTRQYKIPLDLFWELADTVYDSGYGGPEVATDLIVCGDDWWLERQEYDGSEWWELKKMPQEPEETRAVKVLTVRQASRLCGDYVCSWSDLDKLNKYVDEIATER